MTQSRPRGIRNGDRVQILTGGPHNIVSGTVAAVERGGQSILVSQDHGRDLYFKPEDLKVIGQFYVGDEVIIVRQCSRYYYGKSGLVTETSRYSGRCIVTFPDGKSYVCYTESLEYAADWTKGE